MIDIALYDYIYDNLTLTTDFKLGDAGGSVAPYIVMFKVNDPERPETVCEKQGDSGRALFQFSGYAGGTDGEGANAYETITILEALKVQVANIRGDLGTAPDDYNIWQNITGGVRLLNDGGQTLQTWGAFFECNIWWKKL